MFNFDKDEIKKQLTEDDIYQLLAEFGGEPEFTDFGILSATICHNPAGEGSRKLYYYSNSGLFYCYSGCVDPSFDVFELVIKLLKIQKGQKINLNDAVRYIAYKFGILVERVDDKVLSLEDWKIFDRYNLIHDLEIKDYNATLKEYDCAILNRFNYNVRLTPWLNDNISQDALTLAQIGFYPGGDQITIPHFDVDNRLVGIRGRTLCAEEAERFGKYRPIKKNRNEYYNHPLGFNLYGINWAKDNIANIKKVIVLESEKSVLQYISYFGKENDIAVACCGSNLSAYQVEILRKCGAEEIIIAFDRQFENIGDEDSKVWAKKLQSIGKKYKNYIRISTIFDKNMITGYKSSPTDEGKEKFLQLFKERIIL